MQNHIWPGISTDNVKERAKFLNMSTKLTDKNMQALESGAKDADLGLACPSMLGIEGAAGSSSVKEEVPSLPILQELLKTLKIAYLFAAL